jgi:hypothetical protein
MKFYRLNEIPCQNEELAGKASAVAGLWSVAIVVGLIVLVVGTGQGQLLLKVTPPFFRYVMIAIFAAWAWMVLGRIRACRKPTNWLLRCTSSGVMIKYRSFRNWRCPQGDVQAVGFNYSEIAWVRTVKERRISPGLGDRGSVQAQDITYLDFGLVNADTAELEAHLQAEQKAEPPGRFKTIYRDYPVEVLPGGIVQLCWSGMGPSPKKVMQFLQRYVKTAAPESTVVNLIRDRKAPLAEEDAKILMLARSGDKMGAVALTREVYGSTLTEAVAFVNELQARR